MSSSPARPKQRLAKIRRHRGCKGHDLPGPGMGQGQPGRVQGLALQAQFGPGRAIDRVPGHRMAQGGHMHPDLVGAAGFQPGFQQRKGPIALQHPPMGHRRPAGRIDGHALAVRSAPADGGVDRALVLPQVAFQYGDIGAPGGMGLQLVGQALVGQVVFGHHHQPAGHLIDPVHDPGPQGPAHPGQVRKPVQQGVHQRAVRVPRGGVHHHALGLVHHRDVPILVYDGDGDILRPGFQLHGRGQPQGHLIPRLQLIGCLGRFAVYQPAPLGNGPLGLGPAYGKGRSAKGVQPLAAGLHRLLQLLAPFLPIFGFQSFAHSPLCPPSRTGASPASGPWPAAGPLGFGWSK